MFRRILRGAGFSFGGTGSVGMLCVGGIGRELSGGSRHGWSPVFMVGAGWAVGWDGAGKLLWGWEIGLGVGGDRWLGLRCIGSLAVLRPSPGSGGHEPTCGK